ncbi:oligosaccharide flippase family protein [Bacteroidota bacterium]
MNNIYKNSVLYLIANFIINGAGFLLLPLYTVIISPDEFGVIFLIEAAALFLSRTISLSLRGSINRFYFEDKSKEAVTSMYTTIVTFLFIFSIVIYFILSLLYHPVSNALKIYNHKYLLLGLFISFLSVFYPLILSLLYAREEGKKISVTITIIGLISIGLNVLFVLNSEDKIQGYLTALGITAFLKFLIFIFYSIPYLKFSLKFTKISKYLKYGLHQLPSDISGLIITFADRFMVNSMKGLQMTGIYSTGYKIGQANQIIFDSINKAYVPFVFTKYGDLNERNKGILSRTLLNLFALFTFISIAAIVFHKEIIWLLDDRYKTSAIILAIILYSYLIDGYRFLFNPPLAYNVKFVKYKSIIIVLSGILNIILNLILIPKYSVVGAAIATLATFIIRLIFIMILSRKAIKIDYSYKQLLNVFIVSIIFLNLIFLKLNFVNFIIKSVLMISFIFILMKISSLKFSDIKGLMQKKLKAD